jgi:UDP-N-acetylmuramoyl-L-alanyl-D-glutamate--2,6-diaminopimelate ligase
VIITSDNPRTESPASIIEMIGRGLPGGVVAERIVDRAAAIARALAAADARDVVLIAGKGHEDYQDAGGVKTHFSDVEQARTALARRSRGGAGGASGASGSMTLRSALC